MKAFLVTEMHRGLQNIAQVLWQNEGERCLVKWEMGRGDWQDKTEFLFSWGEGRKKPTHSRVPGRRQTGNDPFPPLAMKQHREHLLPLAGSKDKMNRRSGRGRKIHQNWMEIQR